ncbi:MAG TPA: hypothetical protein VMG59_11675 [Phycisphaerae bacterium]|nr:hypothetical protein [Phycisphaerae bacterium]
MLHYSKNLLIIALIVFAFIGHVQADTQTSDTQTFAPKATKQAMRTVTNELNSNNSKQIDQAIGQIEFWISSGGQVPPQLGQQWLPALINDKQFQATADAALNGLLARPNVTVIIQQLMPWRIKALLVLGQTQQALQAAKSYYNVCSMQNTNQAIGLVAQCLTVCNPDDMQIVQTFRDQQRQSAGSETNVEAEANAVENAPATQPVSVLQTIQIDPTLYNDAIDKWNAQSTLSGKFDDYVCYANLLLMADRDADAQKVFTNLYQYLANNTDESQVAAEGLARCMRAEDGTVFRAKTWWLALQKKNGWFTVAKPTAISFAPKATKSDMQTVVGDLNSGDSKRIDQAVGQIEFWIANGGQVPKNLGRYWLPAMIKDQQFQAAADAALNGSLAQPNIANISECMPWRIKALLALNKPQEALEAAKSYYNVCNMQNTNDAVDLVAQCLAVCHPDDLQIVQAFRAEQSGSGAGNANLPNQAETDVAAGNTLASQSTSTLQSVQIDPTLYNDAIGKWNAQSTLSNKFYDFVAYANLLLMADRGDDAQKIFTRLYQLADTQAELNDAAEGIARSMRAEDGTVFRANAWLLSLQKASATPAAAPQ